MGLMWELLNCETKYLDRPLMAGCSKGDKSHHLYVTKESDMKYMKYVLNNIFLKDGFCHFM